MNRFKNYLDLLSFQHRLQGTRADCGQTEEKKDENIDVINFSCYFIFTFTKINISKHLSNSQTSYLIISHQFAEIHRTKVDGQERKNQLAVLERVWVRELVHVREGLHHLAQVSGWGKE